MSHAMVAFNPAPPGKHHPAPWRAARAGYAFDILIEISIPASAIRPEGLSDEDVIWWIAALIRLCGYPYAIVPVISDFPFAEGASSKDELSLKPFETENRFLHAGPEPQPLDAYSLQWIKEKWAPGAKLLAQNPKLKSSLQALDACTVKNKTSASLLAVWGGLEQLFAPSAGELRFRVASYISSYLEPLGPKRLEMFKRILKLYDERSSAAHTARDGDARSLADSWLLLRAALLKMIDDDKVPSQSDLESLLFCDQP
ncbi:hypothetical protein HB770_19970 [Rhizobium leguminosarum bv. viciae]|uniref:Apea-like HEPN domain-containing protein n=1 Tax=Rhizobium leguminosarum bv. viciae TaxID=387 RepID=A0A7G6RKV9_RHILV|nr:hypothetical protein HB770_19970 [Rhizobium leguminosarum bv. viciae]